LAEEVRDLKKQIKSLETMLPKLSVELGGFDTTRSELSKLIPELESQSKLSAADKVRLSVLSAKVEKCKNDMSSCAELASYLEAQVSSLQKDILDAGGPKLKKQQSLCEKIRKQVKDTEKALNTAKVTITSSEKAIGKAREAQASAEQELEECKQALESKKEEQKSIEERALAVMQSFDLVKKVEAGKRAALDESTKECDVLRKSQSDMKVSEIEIAAKVENLGKQLDELERKQQYWEAAIEKLKGDMAEDDEDLSDEDEGRTSIPTEDVVMSEVDDPDSSPGDTVGKQDKLVLPTYSPEKLAKFSSESLKEEISILETERNSIAKNANMGAIAEYRKKEVDYLAR
jgi:structural maintenance of chromosome 4